MIRPVDFATLYCHPHAGVPSSVLQEARFGGRTSVPPAASNHPRPTESPTLQAPIMLILEAGSLASMLVGGGRKTASLQLWDIPSVAIEDLGLRGLSIPASLLAGRSMRDLDRLRDAADKTGCPCLVLRDETPLAFGSPRAGAGEAAMDRLQRLATAASHLGCSSLAIACEDHLGDSDAFAAAVREGVKLVERRELNFLLTPGGRSIDGADSVIELIRAVGGFRIGCMPTFAHAMGTSDPEGTLRRLAPYASAMLGELEAVKTKRGEDADALVATWIRAVRAVGFASTLALGAAGRSPIKRIASAREHLEQAMAASVEEEGE